MTNSTQRQIPQIGQTVISVEEHSYPFAGRVVSINMEKFDAVVFGKEIRNTGLSMKEEERTVALTSIEKIEDRFVISRLKGYRGTHPKTDNVIEVATKQQLEQRDQANVLWEALKFMSSAAHQTHQRLIGSHMTAIRLAAENLMREEASVEISQMAEMLMQTALDTEWRIVQNNGGRDAFWLNDFRLRNTLLKMDYTTLKKLLNEEGMKTLFPETKGE